VTCDEVLGRLDDYLDRNLSTEEIRRVDEHLDECLSCLQKYRFEKALLDGIRTRLRRISLPPQLMASITLRLNAAGKSC
jgi:anti-sigma factor (TIGR02949 family)